VKTNNKSKVYDTSVPHKSRPEKHEGYGRSYLLFHGCYILETSPGVIDFTFVHCYDFAGWVHDKFVTAEKSKTAARMSKLVKGTKGAVLTTPSSPLVLNSAPVQNNNSKVAQFSTSNTYAEYNTLIRDAQPTFYPESSNPHQSAPTQNLQSTGQGPNFCPGCGNATKGMRFCATCGNKLF